METTVLSLQNMRLIGSLPAEPCPVSLALAYTMAKYGMSMCVLGMAEEFRGQISVNALWPKTGKLMLLGSPSERSSDWF